MLTAPMPYWERRWSLPLAVLRVVLDYDPPMSESKGARTKTRCQWCGTDPLYVQYHDDHWGVPVFDDRLLFEFLILEGAQAGLSWITILRKRKTYLEAFDGFQPERVARFSPRKVERLLENPGIVRNRLKIESAIKNAKAFLKVQEELGSFAEYQWSFVGGKPKQNAFASLSEIPAATEEAALFSKDLKRRGFTFVGPTIIYAHMQAVGMVNDHVIGCFRHRQVARLGRRNG